MTDPDPWAQHLTYQPEPRPAPPARRSRVVPLLALGIIGASLAAVIAVFLAVRAGNETPAPAAPPQIIAAVDNVDYFVGTNLAVGAYRQAAATPACYWRVTEPITSEVIEESLPGATGPITVNLGQDVKFRSAGCGAWVPLP